MIMKERSKLSQTDTEKLSMCMMSTDGHDMHMTGQIIDRIYNKDGELVQTIEGHNLVVNSFLKLVMALCKGEAGYSGIQYWAIGSGDTSWDDEIPDPEINASRLTAEIGRIPITPSEISFLNASGAVSTTPTNILQIKHVFDVNDCNGKWREFGIFGGNATSEANTGILINKRHHDVITKTNEMIIERTMRFTLNLI